jgi:hypothetical protein
MYSSVRDAVKINAGVTPSFVSNIGLKQGCNLSPTLFNVFINHIPELFISKDCDPRSVSGRNESKLFTLC